MKNNRVTARRILQGGAAFAALGALSISTALPAAADTEYYGWAYAHVGDYQGVSQIYSGTTSNSYSGSVGDWLTFSGTSSATVNADGVTSTATVDTAKVQITVSDVEQIVEENLDEKTEDGETDEAPEESEAPTEAPEESEAPTEAPEESEAPTEVPEESEAPEETETPEETKAPEAPEESEAPEETKAPEAGESAPETTIESAPSEETEPLVLNEENTELSSGSGEVVLDATLSGVTTTTTQNWDGEVSRSAEIADISYPDVVTLDDGQEVTVWIDIQAYEGTDEFVDEHEEYSVAWKDAYTGYAVTFTVDGAKDPFYHVKLAASSANVGTAEINDGTGDGDEDKGDDKPAPTHPEDKEEDKGGKKDDSKKLENAESLAQTGSPVVGLIAAGAAIATGGGAAAYLARRKKNAADSATETSED
ncbi:LPXTG-motif cell wall-anchored protein [Nocardiopsis arvandica]|uniref:LPXTG-motif cell wall-anchored protein n=1 Tax=Nocardiopsis sinuspersici TaxID=501010 RepID=A0A7Y9XAQ1_9ACTN|nr:LPXTG cell wall anchor domain-containing protein [Nocardiopsis sinuspersici]NYH52327.1 LPXTG-motif cell wall-anchored protein [Nocardiopsis sinuspersici]